jgi:hypothetical protein
MSRTHELTWVSAELPTPLRYRMIASERKATNAVKVPEYREQVAQWMQEHQCGWWIHNYMVAFKTEQEAAMFLLRWV